MKVREYFERIGKFDDVTFIKARARKDSGTPYYHPEYQTTPSRIVEEWEKSNLMDYILLNHKQSPIEWLSGSGWKNRFNQGYLHSLLIISKEDLELLYSKEQAERLEKYIEKKIIEDIEKSNQEG